MGLQNTRDGYGLVARLLHWLMAIVIIGLFAMGLWMHDLPYTDPWYRTAPFLHKSIGITLMGFVLFRLIWRWTNTKPRDGYLTAVERVLSLLVHWLFYLLLFALGLSGYLLSTADGRPIEVFGLFTIPSLYQSKIVGEAAGEAHEILAYVLIGLAVLHLLAALKHHFLDQDLTLRRMWSGE